MSEMKKLLSAVMVITIILSNFMFSASAEELNCTLSEIPPLSDLVLFNIEYHITNEAGQRVLLSLSEQSDGGLQDKIKALISNFDFLNEGKIISKIPDNYDRLNFVDLKNKTDFSSFVAYIYSDYVIFRKIKDGKSTYAYCDYNGNNLRTSLENLLSSIIETQKAKPTPSLTPKPTPTPSPTPALNIKKVENFKVYYNAKFSVNNISDFEWGLFSYNILGSSEIKYACFIMQADNKNYFFDDNFANDKIFYDVNEYIHEPDSGIYKNYDDPKSDKTHITLYPEFDESLNVTAMKFELRETNNSNSPVSVNIDMKTYKATGKISDFPGYKFKASVKPTPTPSAEPTPTPTVTPEVTPSESPTPSQTPLPISDTTSLPVADSSEWSVSDIEKSIELSIVPDYLQNKYTNNISRAEFCDLAFAMLEETVNLKLSDQSSVFDDTENMAVITLWENKIIMGRAEKTFDPESLITREEAVTILSRIADFVNIDIPKISDNIYSDEENISVWAKEAVKKMEAINVMKGVGENMFSPKSNYTREQAIVTMLRIYNIIK